MSKVSVQSAAEVEPVDSVERRRSQRAEFLVRIDYSTVDELFSEFTRDINEGGLFIETEKPSPVGTLVSMQFNLPGCEQPFQTQGVVVRISPGDDSLPPGMGIEFEELTPEDRVHIDQLVRTLRCGMPGRSSGSSDSDPSVAG